MIGCRNGMDGQPPIRSLTEVIAQRCADAYYAGGPFYAAEVFDRTVIDYELPLTLMARVADHYRAILNRRH